MEPELKKVACVFCEGTVSDCEHCDGKGWMELPFLGEAINFLEPVTVTIPQDLLDNACIQLESGIEYAKTCLVDHDSNLGRTHRKNRIWAERMESDITQMESCLKVLQDKAGIAQNRPL